MSEDLKSAKFHDLKIVDQSKNNQIFDSTYD